MININIPNRIGHGEGGSGVAQLGQVLNEVKNVFELHATAFAGDISFEVTPETVDANITDQNGESYTREVEIKLVNTDGDIHEWFNADITVSIAETTAGDGTASIENTTVAMEDGVATVEITLAGTWAADDTNTLTVAEDSILGYTVASATSVETSVE